MDATDIRSFRPISNLSIISRLLERLALKYQIVNSRLPQFQAAYRPARRQTQLPASAYQVFSEHETPSTVVRDLGICLDSDAFPSLTNCLTLLWYSEAVT